MERWGVLLMRTQGGRGGCQEPRFFFGPWLLKAHTSVAKPTLFFVIVLSVGSVKGGVERSWMADVVGDDAGAGFERYVGGGGGGWGGTGGGGCIQAVGV